MSDAKVQIFGMVHSQNVLGPLMIATHYKLGELAFTNLFEDRTPEFKAMNPFNKCPVLKDGDFVIIEYKSFNSKGQMYDSSDGPGRKPLAAKYKANQILAGWEEALETMREGGTRVLQVPANLAYGEKGVCFENGECLVQPGERLQFELTLKRVAMPPATTRDF